MLLAIDTSAGTSVAVVDGPDRVLAQLDEPDTRSHAERIGTLIAAALADAGVTPREIDAVAAGLGPGPFTGLRVGIAAARAFALGIGRPVVGVPAHEAVALDRPGPVLVVTDARRRELAWSGFGTASDSALASGGGVDARLPRLVRGPELVLAADADALFAALAAESGPLAGAERIDAPVIPAGPLGLLAERHRTAGSASSVLEPLYLRAPDVTLSAGPKRVTA
ncbi:tRNA (adenosine(37)-N6)-threonylcarbamoyltransferase complex dimerization subunit type 1 TsaB [Schumannella sp. 10F1B-5-1]|uniref:tRNA (adenosine(37)-N6)-threonylcarbamoyltransferase complex dimerization subunit type 1 TsaB n=1 Tax=Schumannella sp. 10F1B-5-1 TaxID=2590780 RepID=UPI001130857A|nr:tRNA (adenosine(37)-N6)-threonylcarbamoyltransferase complex dimerization subunit type 1 TsaB [Schumannella sp. 10F1B-5-1]TPW71773.1 tRNA (adenosine(37)-N6)-threonylcarbamoyltransferase complex dimerization subunit type 1 TsaB [Schumannella sp. 10F1B-5-1]